MSPALLVILLFIAAEKCPWIPSFVARKLTHFGSGILLYMAPNTLLDKVLIVTLSALVPLASWYRPMRFTNRVDPGITTFAATVIFYVLAGYDLKALAPIFFADPIAALVGRYARSPKLYKAKTWAGSIAFFIASYLTLSPASYGGIERLCMAGICTLCEALSSGYDNIIVAIPITLRRMIKGF